MKNRLPIAAASLLALAIAASAFAGVESYFPHSAVPAEQITGAVGADSTVATTAISDRALTAEFNPTVAVSVDFSGAAADTCVVSCLLYVSVDGGTTLTFIGLSSATATAGAFTDAAGDNFAPVLFFDLAGATHYEIRHAAPSAGNVDLRYWSYGSRSKQ